MMECDMSCEVYPTGLTPTPHPLTIPIHISQWVVTALLNTGSLVSMVRAHLVPENRATICLTTIAGVHWQLQHWPVVWVSLMYKNQTHVLQILNVGELPFPVLLGCNSPGFSNLVQTAIPSMEEEEEDAILGPITQVANCTHQVNWQVNPAFLQAQQTDTTLDHLLQDIVVSEGAIIDPHKAIRYPHLESRKGVFWRIVALPQRGWEEHKQLIVPSPFRV